jgi:hypothetical protein
MITQKSMVDGVGLTSSTVRYYTVPSKAQAVIKKATFVNDSTTVVTVTINLLRVGGTAGYANRLVKAKALSPGQTWICSSIENHELEAGGFISMLASVTEKVGCRISGYEVT